MAPRVFWVWLVGAGLVVSSILFATLDAGGAETKRILFLHSFGRDFKPWSDHSRQLREELSRQSPWPLDVQDYELTSARTANDDPDVVFVDYLRANYAKGPPHLIIASGAPAAAFLQRHRPELFPTVPALYGAVDRRFAERANLTDNDAAVALVVDLPATFRNIQQLLPDTKKIFGLLGASRHERLWATAARTELAFLEGRIEVVWLNDLSFEDILKEVASAPPNSAVFWGPVRIDGAGVTHPGDAALKRLYAATNAPIFSFTDTFFTGETVGGSMLNVALIEKRTAEVAVRLLQNERPSSIVTEPIGHAAPRYDWRQLQRWGISESQLPPGSEVLFRELSVWERYRWQLLLAVVTIIVQFLLIAALFYQGRRRASAEAQSRQRMTELAHMHRQLVADELSVSISHELNQPLGAILSNAEAMELLLNAHSPNLNEVKQIVADIKRDDHRASEVLRRLRSLLKKAPFELKVIDLNSVVTDTVEFVVTVCKARGVSLNTSVTRVPLQIKGDLIQLQQVVVNLVLNAIDAMVATTSERRQIEIGSGLAGNFAELWVADSGPGVPPDKLREIFEPFVTTKASGMGMGLSIARTIVEAHDGTISVENQSEGGALFRIRLPIERTSAAGIARPHRAPVDLTTASYSTTMPFR